MVEKHLGNQPTAANLTLKEVSGFLHLSPHGYGFLRPTLEADSDPADIYLSHTQIRRFGLRQGDFINAQARPPKHAERYWAAVRLERINHQPNHIKTASGYLHLEKTYGFLRPATNAPSHLDDIYIAPSQIERFSLEADSFIDTQARPPKEDERYWAALSIESVDRR